MPKAPHARIDRLDAERMFVAVLDTGAFAAAARRLGTSPGQASKLVARLEAELGVQLLKRTTRALWPTEAGEAYHRDLKTLIEDFDRLEATIRSAAGTPSGRLRLSAPLSFGKLQLTPHLLEFAALYPRIDLDVSFSDRHSNLIDEGFDLALRIGAPQDSTLIARRLCDCRIVTVAARSYLDLRGEPLSPAELDQHDCIRDGNFRDANHWPFASPESLAPQAVPVRGRLRFSDGEACLAAAEAGLGIARLPSFIAGPALRAGRVDRLLAAYDGPPLAIHLLYPPARDLALKVRSLMDFLVERFRGSPGWDQGW